MQSPKFVLLSLVGIALARITRDQGGLVALSDRVHLVDRKSRGSGTTSIAPSSSQEKQNLFEMLATLLFSFYFPFPQTFLAGLDKMQMFSPHAGVSRWWEPLSNTANKPSVNRFPTCISMQISEHQKRIMETVVQKSVQAQKVSTPPLGGCHFQQTFLSFTCPKKGGNDLSAISLVILGIRKGMKTSDIS